MLCPCVNYGHVYFMHNCKMEIDIKSLVGNRTRTVDIDGRL